MDKAALIRALSAEASKLEASVQSAAFDSLREVGDYGFSEVLLGVARDIRAIGRRIESLASDQSPVPQAMTAPALRAPKRSRSAYPKFLVTEDRIVKIGKGKSPTAQEYRHEAPREAFQRLASWLDTNVASGSREWVAQDAVDALAGEVPSYQTYLMLAALRCSGILSPTRRGSYELSDHSAATSDYWSMLRARFGSEPGEPR